MKKILCLMAVLSLALASTAVADPITGTINFAGNLTTDSNNILNATSATSFSDTFVFASVDDLSTPFATAAVFNAPWTFEYAGPSFILWSAGAFSFELLSSHIEIQGPSGSNNWLNVSAYGIIHGNGFDDTYGTFGFHTARAAAFDTGTPSSGPVIFSFGGDSASTGASVPDGGATALLVGLGLIGMSVAVRRRK